MEQSARVEQCHQDLLSFLSNKCQLFHHNTVLACNAILLQMLLKLA